MIFDEMSIQQDIQMDKNGNMLELTGFTELGKEGDICHQLRKGSKNKTLRTHVLQMLYLGLNGFRFPVAFSFLIIFKHLNCMECSGIEKITL